MAQGRSKSPIIKGRLRRKEDAGASVAALRGIRKPWKCRTEESPENQTQVFRPSHRSWKSLRDSHIPTATMTTTYTFEPKTQTFKERNP